MAGPFKPFRTADVNLNAVQAAVRDFADQLEDARQGVAAFPVAIVTRRTQLSTETLVRYMGSTDTVLLPAAQNRGRGRGQVIWVIHEGTGTLTLLPAASATAGPKDTLTPAVALTTGQMAILASDGLRAWFALVPPSFTLPNVGPGAGTYPPGGTGVASVTLDAQGRTTAVATATYLTGLPNVGPGAGSYGPWANTIGLDAQGRVTGVTVAASPVTSVKANSGGTPILGAVEFDGAGDAVTSEGGQIVTITGKRSGSLNNYVHSPTLSGLTNFFVAGAAVTPGFTTRTNVANQLVAIPFVAPTRGGSLDRIAVEVTTGVAATNVRMGVYLNAADDNLYPGSLLADSGLLPTTAASVQVGTIGVTLTPGALYWAVLNSSSAATVLRGMTAASCSDILGMQSAAGVVNGNVGIAVTLAFAAMPATFTAGGVYITSAAAVPLIQLRIT